MAKKKSTVVEDVAPSDEDAPEPVTPKQLALALGADARTVRKFLRSDKGKGFKVGQGNRWQLDAEELPDLTKAWDGWRRGVAKRSEKIKTADVEEPQIEDDFEEELLDLDDV